MGDRMYMKVKCECGNIDEEVYYASTCGFMTWKCPKCEKVTNLEEYSGVNADSMATTKYGTKFIGEQREKLKNVKN